MSKDIVNERGEKVEGLAIYCPKCGHHKIQKGNLSGQDFDETGWFHTQEFICLNLKCGHRWSNKIMIQRGGYTSRYI